jgi:hypothetical protein
MDLKFEFRNIEQEIYFFHLQRNGCFSGGFNNGKTYVACQRALLHLLTFNNYRMAICRKVYKQLRATTMQTFFKICPKEFIFRHDEQFGITILYNGSVIYWMHLDTLDEGDAKGLEINSLLIDQAEDTEENIVMIMDARVGRWDGAVVPQRLLDQYPNWPKDDFGRPRVNNYVDILCNPFESGEFHWIYRWYHPDSYEKDPNYFFIERETDDRLGDPHTMAQMKKRDAEWIETYYKGKWGKSKSQIHFISPLSLIDPDKTDKTLFDEFVHLLRTKANIYRILDHGDTAPTCCTWWAALKYKTPNKDGAMVWNDIHVCFQEYYVPGELISFHRQNIFDLSEDLNISGDFADPAIFKTSSQKNGMQWSVAQEYYDEDEIQAPAFHWIAADNNEFATRNRINELLRPVQRIIHPITKVSPAPQLYFIKRSNSYPYGAHRAIIETQSQRRELTGSYNGKSIYSDDRDESIVDHAYDTVRYYVAQHNKGFVEKQKEPPQRSFARYNKLFKEAQRQGLING